LQEFTLLFAPIRDQLDLDVDSLVGKARNHGQSSPDLSDIPQMTWLPSITMRLWRFAGKVDTVSSAIVRLVALEKYRPYLGAPACYRLAVVWLLKIGALAPEGIRMRRRAFIRLLGGAADVPLARGARAATEQGWTLIAKDGNALGYVDASALAQMQ
jgi:hypothetical protein